VGYHKKPKDEPTIWTGLGEFALWFISIQKKYKALSGESSSSQESGVALNFGGESQGLPLSSSSSSSQPSAPAARVHTNPLLMSTDVLINLPDAEIEAMDVVKARRFLLAYKARLGSLSLTLNQYQPDMAEVAGREERWYALFTPLAILRAYLGKSRSLLYYGYGL